MSNLGESLLDEVRALFEAKTASDAKLAQLAKRIRDGTYYDASDYAVRLGELLGESLNDSTKTLAFMSREVAEEVLGPMLRQDHDLLALVIEMVQKRLNEANGFGLNPVIPEVDTNRIAGIIEKVASGETLDEVRWMFGEPIINYSQSVVDQAIRDNAKATSKLGLTGYIIREAETAGVKQITRGKKKVTYQVPCKWCANLAGRYKSTEAPKDVYRRHESCRCHLTFEYGGRRQDAWSKVEWTDQESAERARLIREAERQKLREQEELTNRVKEALGV